MHTVEGGPDHGGGDGLLTRQAMGVEGAVHDDLRLRVDLANDAGDEGAVTGSEVENRQRRSAEAGEHVQQVDVVVAAARPPR